MAAQSNDPVVRLTDVFNLEDEAQFSFAPAKPFLCASLIIDVGEQAVPTGNAATVVLKWRDVGVHPPVDAIEAPHPDVIFQSPSE